MHDKNVSRRNLGLGLIGIGALGLTGCTAKLSPEPSASPSPSPTPDLRKASHDPNSTSVLVNKINPLQPQDYAPTDLVNPGIQLSDDPTAENQHMRKEAADALTKMGEAAKAAGVELTVVSAYRSYQTQIAVYNDLVATYGQVSADERSARPGFSEHQTGQAVDIGQTNGDGTLNQDFGNTPAGQWLAANCNNYGFIIRFPQGQEAITGYMYEPWHVRYVGTEIAQDMKTKGIPTLEQYFNQPPAPAYAGEAAAQAVAAEPPQTS